MVRFLTWVVVLGAIVGGLLYKFALDVWRVPVDDELLSASIAPSLDPGDLVILTRHPSMTHGYLVRCEDPQAPGHYVVGRAIAAGGETVTFDQEVVSIDGHRTPSGHACDPATRTVYDPETGAEEALGCAVEEYGEADFEVLLSRIDPHPSTPKVVEPGTWFLVSDNRHIHDDSRDYGGVDPRTCQHLVVRLLGTSGLGLHLLW
jgi:signal peptidase I